MNASDTRRTLKSLIAIVSDIRDALPPAEYAQQKQRLGYVGQSLWDIIHLIDAEATTATPSVSCDIVDIMCDVCRRTGPDVRVCLQCPERKPIRTGDGVRPHPDTLSICSDIECILTHYGMLHTDPFLLDSLLLEAALKNSEKMKERRR